MSRPAELFEEMQRRISGLVANSPAKDVERNIRAVMAQGFTKLDLVTREDFDIQAEVLARTRARLTELESRVAALEAKTPAA
ncbi:accessory factor UbiK family protein [soil metagenome]